MTPQVPSEQEVLSYFNSLSNWGRWGEADKLGTLNLISPAKRIAAAELVRVGITVSCAWDIGAGPRTGPILGATQRFMLATGERPGSTGAGDYLGIVYHGYTVTHVDALSHVFWEDHMYNGRPADLVTAPLGAMEHDVAGLKEGVLTRGVLLDVTQDRDWLDPGDPVFPEDLEAAEKRQGVRVDEGDVLLLRTGYGRKVRQKGPDDVATVGRAGWHAACLPWFHDRGVAVIACDTAQDAQPSGYPTFRSPIHSVGIVAMGLWLVDNCDLEELAETCERLGRWEFLFTLAPLRWVGATGSPTNPLATF